MTAFSLSGWKNPTDYYAELHEEELQLPEDAGDEDEEVDVNEDYEENRTMNLSD